MSSQRDAAIYREGVLDALRAFAIHKNGDQIVGCGVYSLRDVTDRVDEFFPAPSFDEHGNPSDGSMRPRSKT